MDGDSNSPEQDPAAERPPDPHDRAQAAEGDDASPSTNGSATAAAVVLTERAVEIGSEDLDSGPRVGRSDFRLWLVRDEVIRAAVALLLFGLLAYVIFKAFQRAETWAETKQLLDGVLPAVTALLGSAVGFYFGTKVG